MESAELKVGAGGLPPPPPVPEGAVPSTVQHFLKSCEELVAVLSDGQLSPQLKYEAAHEVRIRTKTNAKSRAQFGEGGAIPALVELLRTAVDSDDETARESVTHSLLNISIGDNRNKAAVVAAGGVPLLVELLKPPQPFRNKNNFSRESQRVDASEEGGASDSEGVRVSENVDAMSKCTLQLQLLKCDERSKGIQWTIEEMQKGGLQATDAFAIDATNARAGNEAAAAALLTLSCFEGNRAYIGSSGAIPPLVELLITGSDQGREDALTALHNLAITFDNRSLVVRANAIPLTRAKSIPILLHALTLHEKAHISEKILGLLHILATIEEGRYDIAHQTRTNTLNGVNVLATFLADGRRRKNREHAVAILSLLCTNSLLHSHLVMKAEGVIPALESLSESDARDTQRARDKAKELLKHFSQQLEIQAIELPVHGGESANVAIPALSLLLEGAISLVSLIIGRKI